MAFIYKITNTINSKSYIGKTESTVDKRFKQHCSEYTKDRCKDRPLYRAMNKYGLESFTVETLEETTQSSEREIYWIEFYGTYSNGYNATKGGDGKSYVDEELVLFLLIEHDSNCTKVASLVNHNRTTVEKIAKKHGIYKTHFAKGEEHYQAIITPDQVLEIRKLYVPKKFGKRRIAKLLGLTVASVQHVIFGTSWKHLKQ